MKPMGGTEILRSNLEKRINPSEYGINLLTHFITSADLQDGINILWNHQNVDQPSIQGLTNPYLANQLDAIVFVSNWQLENFRRHIQLPLHKCYVIPNAIEPIAWKDKPREKIELIYTSTPWRGLDALLYLYEKMDRDDVHLQIYSSTKIYGDAFDKENGPVFTELFDKAQQIKNVTYHGYATNEEVRQTVQDAHILSYPAIFEETSCLSVIEAASAGCQIVTSNLGALPETSCGFGMMTSMQESMDNFAQRYIPLLNNAIDNYWSRYDQGDYRAQAEFFNRQYSWENRIGAWKELFDQLRRSR